MAGPGRALPEGTRSFTCLTNDILLVIGVVIAAINEVDGQAGSV